jgi:hypothetical protein
MFHGDRTVNCEGIMTPEDQITMYEEAKLEDRMLTCLEIQARMITILDVLEVGQIGKAEDAARRARELAHALMNDLGSDRRQLES